MTPPCWVGGCARRRSGAGLNVMWWWEKLGWRVCSADLQCRHAAWCWCCCEFNSSLAAEPGQRRRTTQPPLSSPAHPSPIAISPRFHLSPSTFLLHIHPPPSFHLPPPPSFHLPPLPSFHLPPSTSLTSTPSPPCIPGSQPPSMFSNFEMIWRKTSEHLRNHDGRRRRRENTGCGSSPTYLK